MDVLKIESDELRFRWKEQNILEVELENELHRLNELASRCVPLRNIRLELEQFRSFERQNIYSACNIAKIPFDQLRSISFTVNPYIAIVESNFIYSREEPRKELALIPKYLAFNKLVLVPLFLTYERRFFSQFYKLDSDFTIDELIMRTLKKKSDGDIGYLSEFYTYLIRRFHSLHLITLTS